MTGGEAHEVKGYEALIELHDVAPDRLLGDKGYDSDAIRNDLAKRGIEPVIPPRSNRKTPIEYDHEAYKRRNLIERLTFPRFGGHRITRPGALPARVIYPRAE